MISVKVIVDVVPYGKESGRQTISMVEIINELTVGGDYGDYVARELREDGSRLGNDVHIKGHKRSTGFAPLVVKAFQSLYRIPQK